MADGMGRVIRKESKRGKLREVPRKQASRRDNQRVGSTEGGTRDDYEKPIAAGQRPRNSKRAARSAAQRDDESSSRRSTRPAHRLETKREARKARDAKQAAKGTTASKGWRQRKVHG
jgi:hypothetical protein